MCAPASAAHAHRLRDHHTAETALRVGTVPARLVRTEHALPPEAEEHADDVTFTAAMSAAGPRLSSARRTHATSRLRCSGPSDVVCPRSERALVCRTSRCSIVSGRTDPDGDQVNVTPSSASSRSPARELSAEVRRRRPCGSTTRGQQVRSTICAPGGRMPSSAATAEQSTVCRRAAGREPLRHVGATIGPGQWSAMIGVARAGSGGREHRHRQRQSPVQPRTASAQSRDRLERAVGHTPARSARRGTPGDRLPPAHDPVCDLEVRRALAASREVVPLLFDRCAPRGRELGQRKLLRRRARREVSRARHVPARCDRRRFVHERRSVAFARSAVFERPGGLGENPNFRRRVFARGSRTRPVR